MPDEATGVYLYGLIRDGDGAVFDVPPISGAGRVYTISHRDLSAVVSDSPLERFELTRRNVRGHQAVLDEVMRTRDILPARLGTLLPSAEAVVEKLLDRRSTELEALLERVAGCVELGLKASWTDLTRILREVVASDRDLRSLRDHLTRHRSAATYEARLELGRRGAAALAARREQDADRLVAELAPHAASVRRNAPAGELMVLSSAFLVGRGRTAAFEAAVREQDRRSDGRLDFLVVGPLPPYNFVCLDGAAPGSAHALSQRRSGRPARVNDGLCPPSRHDGNGRPRGGRHSL